MNNQERAGWVVMVCIGLAIFCGMIAILLRGWQ